MPILYQSAPLKVVLFRRKSRSRAGRPENFEGNLAHAPVLSILKILKKVTLPCGASKSRSRSRAEHPENLEENRALVRSILKIS